MERKVIPEAENRLVILYAMARLGPVTGAQLLQFLVELDLMNYITMQLSLSELEKQGQLVRRAYPGGERWEMTEEGRFALESFEKRVPHSRRALMDREAGAYRARFTQEQLATASVVMLPGGAVCASLRLQEVRALLMELTIRMPADRMPTLIEERWRRCAQAVYGAVMAALTEGYRPDAPMPAAPEDGIRQISENEWLLSLSGGSDELAIGLLLPLPGEHLARCCAARWPEVCGELRAEILTALENADGRTLPQEEVSDKGE